jgi:hypothetical protein
LGTYRLKDWGEAQAFDMSNLERCMESLAFCHVQEASHWTAARSVARQDIDAYLHEAGPKWADRRQALDLLMGEFARRFPDDTDPVLIRSYLRRIDDDLQREAEQKAGSDAGLSSASSPAPSSSTEPPVAVVDQADPSAAPMSDQQRQDIARLCHEANVPDRSDEKLSAESAQQLINELRQKAAEFIRK